MRLGDLVNGTRIMGNRAFAAQFPQLDPAVFDDAKHHLPPAFERALKDGTQQTWGAMSCIPTGLLDDVTDEGHAIVPMQTLVAPTVTPVREARVKDMYHCMQASAFEMPRTLGEGGCHEHLYPPGEGRVQAIARAVRSVTCSGAPPEMAETAYNILMDAFPFGGSKRTEPLRQGDLHVRHAR